MTNTISTLDNKLEQMKQVCLSYILAWLLGPDSTFNLKCRLRVTHFLLIALSRKLSLIGVDHRHSNELTKKYIVHTLLPSPANICNNIILMV